MANIFIPVPNPAQPETMKQAHFDELRRRGFYDCSEDSFFVVASREEWGKLRTGVFPEEGDTPKYWRDNFSASEKPYLYVTGGRVFVENTPTSAGFSHPTFGAYSQAAANTYREFAALIMSMGGVPVLEFRSVSVEEAYRLNVREGMSVAIPIVTMPTDHMLVVKDGVVCAVDYQEFTAWARQQQPQQGQQVVEGKHGIPSAESVAGSKPTKPPVPAPPVPAPAATPNDESRIKVFEGLEFDTVTGEAICNGINTGWTFEKPYQLLPVTGSNPDTVMANQYISPWAFATATTADTILRLLQPHFDDVKLEIIKADANSRFPTSVPQRLISAGGSAKVNAGLIASQIARTVFYDSVNKKTSWNLLAIDDAAASLRAELNRA
jgi:hypothetical protein